MTAGTNSKKKREKIDQDRCSGDQKRKNRAESWTKTEERLKLNTLDNQYNEDIFV